MEPQVRALPFDTRRKSATTILVVDDSPEIRRYLATALEMDHYKVETASSGQEASERLRDGCKAALVLLDLQMPGMDGLQTLRHIRTLRPELKVIMCSAVEDPDIVDEAARLGAQAYLVKPVQHLYLSAAVERCLSGSPFPALEHELGTEILAMLPSAARPN